MTAEGDPRAFFELLNPDLTLDAGFTIHSAMLHMHQLGQSAEIYVDHADGSRSPLLFDNPTATEVNWGEGTDDEMCVGNLYISQPWPGQARSGRALRSRPLAA